MPKILVGKRMYYRTKFYDNIFDEFCFEGNCINIGPISVEFYGFWFNKEIR